MGLSEGTEGKPRELAPEVLRASTDAREQERPLGRKLLFRPLGRMPVCGGGIRVARFYLKQAPPFPSRDPSYNRPF